MLRLAKRAPSTVCKGHNCIKMDFSPGLEDAPTVLNTLVSPRVTPSISHRWSIRMMLMIMAAQSSSSGSRAIKGYKVAEEGRWQEQHESQGESAQESMASSRGVCGC